MALVVLKASALSLGLNYGVHYASAKLYDWVCVPHSWQEVARSLVTTASPVCSVLLQVMTVTQHNYASVMSVAIVSTMTRLLQPA